MKKILVAFACLFSVSASPVVDNSGIGAGAILILHSEPSMDFLTCPLYVVIAQPGDYYRVRYSIDGGTYQTFPVFADIAYYVAGTRMHTPSGTHNISAYLERFDPFWIRWVLVDQSFNYGICSN